MRPSKTPDIKELFNTEGYTFIGRSTESNRFYDYICPSGHKHKMRKDHWLRGVRCPECVGNNKLTIEYVRQSIESEGYIVEDTDYINSKTLINTICPKGHSYKVSWNNWNQGYRCSTCSGRAKKDLSNIKELFDNARYELLSTKYQNNKEPLELICPSGHLYKVSWDNWNSKNSRCPKCNNVGTSIQENELFNFIYSIDNTAYQRDRNIISPLELDIVVPSKKIAIEYCGLFWHSEGMHKERKYHLNKLNRCSSEGYTLITIFEDEWIEKRDIVKSRLANLLGDNLDRIHARKCVIRTITNKVSSLFCKENHLQGYVPGDCIRLGAFFNSDLVGVMTFSALSVAKGSKNNVEGNFELSRFCCKIGYRIPGLFTKMLNYFMKHYKFMSIMSYADRRWSVGNVYEKAGFKNSGNTSPNYWYFKNNDNTKRFHRFALRKTKDEPKDITEWDIRQSQGWNRIWDCGSLKYILEKGA